MDCLSIWCSIPHNLSFKYSCADGWLHEFWGIRIKFMKPSVANKCGQLSFFDNIVLAAGCGDAVCG